MGDKSLFNMLEPCNGVHVTLGDNFKGRIEGIDNINNVSSTFITQVFYVHGLKHNLLVLVNCEIKDILLYLNLIIV